jgi:TusA-related sulfurtransferase
MSDFSGDFKAQLAYSDLKAGILSCPNPMISCKYGNISLTKAENLKIHTQYSDVKVKILKTLQVDNKYSNYKIEQIESIFEGSSTAYGDFNIDVIGDINLILKYSGLNIGMLGRNLKTNCSYSNVAVRESSKKLENINIQGSFSDVKLSLNSELSANLDINLLYGGFDIAEKYNAKFTVTEKTNNKLIKKGTTGNGKPSANIVISNTYADVKIR